MPAINCSQIEVGNSPGAIAITSDGSRVFVVNGKKGANTAIGTISILDNQEVVLKPASPQVDLGSGPYVIAIAPDGNRIFVLNRFGNGDRYAKPTITTLDNNGKELAGSPVTLEGVADGGICSAMAMSRDGQYIFVCTGNNIIILENGKKVSESKIAGSPIAVGNSPYGLAMAPDGSRVFVTNLGSNSVSVLEPFLQSAMLSN